MIIDGDLASDRLFASLLAALLPGQTVVVSSEPQGVAMGAALLWDWSVRSEPAPLDLTLVLVPRLAGLAGYERRWRRAAAAATGA